MRANNAFESDREASWPHRAAMDCVLAGAQMHGRPRGFRKL